MPEIRGIHIIAKGREGVHWRQIEAEVYGNLALHPCTHPANAGADWTVSHIPTGRVVTFVDYKYQGRGIIGELIDLDWSGEEEMDIAKETKRLAPVLMEAFRELPKDEQRKRGELVRRSAS